VLRNPWHVEPRTRFSTEYPVKSARSDKRLTNRLLDAALSARVEALTPAQGDPFEDVDVAAPMAA
jgi:hypothetical protein